ncbi:MAG TPA: response regulator [Verrucomicrobiae bacterium]|jgi:PAS domain S-box-containing protein
MSLNEPIAATLITGKVVNILLVDDEARNLDVLESILTSPAYHLVRARTAEEALMALLDGTFAVMVLDIQMPGTNGIELAHLIKQRKRTQHIPIIFLTAYYQEDKDVLQGYEVGAVDYLTKPVDARILKSKIAVFVELFQKNQELTTLNGALENEVAQRIKAEQALRQANAELEDRVQERAAKLIQSNEDLRASNLAVQQSEQRYRQLISNLPAAVYTTDAAGRVTLFNEAAANLWGGTLEVGKDLWAGSYRMFRPEGTDLPPDQSPMTLTLKTGQAVRGQEIIIERPDGSRRNILPYPDPILDVSGKVTGAVNMILDITERKRTEEASRRLAAIVESSTEAIISKNLNGIITSWNAGAEELFGYQADEVIGQSITVLIPPERWGEVTSILERIRRGERIEHYETIRRCKDGSLMEVLLTISPVKDEQGKVAGVSKIVRDITQQKYAERELERVHQEVVAASRAKDDFLAALSHELRTPLNPVLLLASEAAENPELSPAIRADFTIIRNNIELEARLIDDLLDLTRITKGKLSLNMDVLDVHAVLYEAIAIVQPELDNKKLSLAVELAGENAAMNGDAVRLQQIFWNVLKNAVKFTPYGGKISVKTRLHLEDKKISIEIKDTGIGLTVLEIGHIFNAFSQGEHAVGQSAHRFGGLGLGLTISRMLVELHSGAIHAKSDGRGQGATFIIELPLSPTEEKPNHPTVAVSEPKNAASAAAKIKSSRRILLVEDHEATRTALTYLLTRQQCQVSVAASVAEARQLAQRESFDIVLSDIGLPDGDGYTLMAELHAKYGLKGIALTGYGMEQDVARSHSAGFFVHLTKPIRMESLKKILHEAL